MKKFFTTYMDRFHTAAVRVIECLSESTLNVRLVKDEIKENSMFALYGLTSF